jgi:hypothetical protein
MKLDKIAEAIGATIITPSDISKIEIRHVYAGDKMSDLLNEASDDTLLVTNLQPAAHPCCGTYGFTEYLPPAKCCS